MKKRKFYYLKNGKIKSTQKSLEYVEGKKGIEKLIQLANVYDLISSRKVMKLLIEENRKSLKKKSG